MSKLINSFLQPLRLISGINIKGKKGRKNKPLWHAAFGWSVSVAWLMVMSTICWVVISGNPKASEIIMALVDTSSLWGVALGVLGVAFVKGDTPTVSVQPKKTKKKIT